MGSCFCHQGQSCAESAPHSSRVWGTWRAASAAASSRVSARKRSSSGPCPQPSRRGPPAAEKQGAARGELFTGEQAQKIHRAAAQGQIIGIPAEPATCFVAARKAYRAAEKGGPPQIQAHGVQRAEPRPHCEQAAIAPARFAGKPESTRHKLAAEVIEPPLLHLGARPAFPPGEPALAVHAVGTKKPKLPALDKRGERGRKAAVLPVVKAAALAGERQAGLPGMAVDLEFHLAL